MTSRMPHCRTSASIRVADLGRPPAWARARAGFELVTRPRARTGRKDEFKFIIDILTHCVNVLSKGRQVMAMIDDTDTSSRLGSRLRDGLTLAQTRIHTIEEQAKHQWEGIPAQARATLNRMLVRIRTTLDLPSRSELASLVERIEELDHKLEALEQRQRLGASSPTGGRATEAPAEVTAQAAEAEEMAAQAAAEAVEAAEQATKEAEAAEEMAKEAEVAAREAVEGEERATKKTAPARKSQDKKNGTQTKKARRTSAGKTLTGGGKKKTATTSKRQSKGTTDKRK